MEHNAAIIEEEEVEEGRRIVVVDSEIELRDVSTEEEEEEEDLLWSVNFSSSELSDGSLISSEDDCEAHYDYEELQCDSSFLPGHVYPASTNFFDTLPDLYRHVTAAYLEEYRWELFFDPSLTYLGDHFELFYHWTTDVRTIVETTMSLLQVINYVHTFALIVFIRLLKRLI